MKNKMYETSWMELLAKWQLGDWIWLSDIKFNSKKGVKDSSNILLWSAVGNFQIGNAESGRQLLEMALNFGSDRNEAIKFISSGVYNSIAKAAAKSGLYAESIKYFKKSLMLGGVNSDDYIQLCVRVNEQFRQCGLEVPERLLLEQWGEEREFNSSFKGGNTLNISPISVDYFYSEAEGDRSKSLMGMRDHLVSLVDNCDLDEVACTKVEFKDKNYWFSHFANDYIPKKMAEKNQFYEFGYLNLLARLHTPGKLIIDCGANIGNHTVFFAGVLGANVIAFEPEPLNFDFLVANLYLNNIQDYVDVRQKALGRNLGTISLSQSIENNWGTFTSEVLHENEDQEGGARICVSGIPLTTLDAELSGHIENISIIKLDIEGMELDALIGARKMIELSFPVVSVECITKNKYIQIKEFLAQYGYFVIDSVNSTPTFIFLTQRNPRHILSLKKYLERSSISKFSSNENFVKGII